MTSRAKGRLSILTAVGLLFSCTSPIQHGQDLGEPASIGNAPPAASVSPGTGVIVVADPLKKSVELGEPVYLAIRVTNTGSESINLVGALRPGDGLVEVYSRAAGKQRVKLPPISDQDFEGYIEVAPGQTVGDVVPIFFGANGWSFTQAGEQWVSVVLRVPAGNGFSQFTSPEALVEVKPSQAGQALLSMENPGKLQAGKFLVWRSGDHLNEGIKILEEISTRYPDAALSSYVSAARVHSLSEPFANYATGNVRPADCLQADAVRKTMDTQDLSDNLLIEDYISQAKCQAESQDWKAAEEALDTGSRLSKERPEFGGYDKALTEMLGRLKRYL